jgi:glutamate transport system substrate-binding protein
VLSASLTACGSGSSGSSSLPNSGTNNARESAQDAVVAAAPVAPASAIPAGSWMDKIRKQGYLRVGGTDAGPLFSLKDPSTGKLVGFDAGLSQMLAKYIIGKPNTKLSLTSVDTRETMLQNGTVDAVFATYTITPQRAQKVDFAGPYYDSGDAILVKKDNTSITNVSDLNGKTVATEGNSTAALDIKKFAPKAKVLLFQEDGECVAAVQQGRADAYVLDQGILLGDAYANPEVKVVGQPFTQEPYGIGVPKQDPEAKAFVDNWLKLIEKDGEWAKLWQATIGKVLKGNPPTPPAIGSVPGS